VGIAAVRKSLKSWLRYPFVLRARARDQAFRARPRHALAVAAIFRDEAPFLDEWLTFHAGIGAGHFYLYNNFSRDDFAKVLAPWIARGMVTLHDWPVEVGQLPAYRHCVRRYADEAGWIAFLDLDEFLFSPGRIDIRPVLAEYADLPGLICYSPYFGSSGHRERPEGPLLEAFTRRADFSLASAKTVANPRWIRAIRNVHEFKYWAGEALDTDRRPLTRDRMGPLDRLRVNHYWSRSLADLEHKVRRGDASTSALRERDRHFDRERLMNAVEDREILPVARAIREGKPLASLAS